MEDRLAPATFVVSETLDASQQNGNTNNPVDTNGLVSLRSAIAAANFDAAKGVSDTITFAADLNGDTITLSQGVLELTAGTGTVTINGGGQIAVSGNHASAVFSVDSGVQAVLSGLTVEDGSAGSGGGINNDGSLTLNDSTVSGNTSPGPGGGGGGILNFGSMTVSDSTISGNTASTGGGGICNGGSLTVRDSTISGNTGGDGGGIYNNPGVSQAVLQNTIVAGNTDYFGAPDLFDAFGPFSASYSLIGNTAGSGITGGTGNILNPTSLGLGALGNNGGPTQTIALLPGSPAIGAGETVAGITTDQRGFPLDSPKPDIGAFQTQTSLVVTTFADPGYPGGAIGELSLREAVSLANAYEAAGGSATITFAPSLNGDEISLSQGPLELTAGTGTTTINGANQIAVVGGPTFQIDSGAQADLSGLDIGGGGQGAAVYGGAIYNAGTLTLSDSTVSGSTIYINVTFAGNNYGEGAGIFNSGTLTMNNSTVSGNSILAPMPGGLGYGAGIYNSGSLTMSDSTVSGNFISGPFFSSGAGIDNTGSLTVINSTISGNTNEDGLGGGIFGSAVLQNTIVAGNASEVGGIAGNSSEAGGDVAGSVSASYCMIGNTTNASITGGTGNILNPSSLGLGALGNNGGPTQTIALLPGSQAIHAGEAIAGITTDQRGDPLDNPPDIGAYQISAPTSAIGSQVNGTIHGYTTPTGSVFQLAGANFLNGGTGVFTETSESSVVPGIVQYSGTVVETTPDGLSTLTGNLSGNQTQNGAVTETITFTGGTGGVFAGATGSGTDSGTLINGVLNLTFSGTIYGNGNGEYDVNAADWNNQIVGIASDAGGPGLQGVAVSLEDTNTGDFWNGTTFVAGAPRLAATLGVGGTWSLAVPSSALTNGDDYEALSRATGTSGVMQTAGSSAGSFVYDTSVPATPPAPTLDPGSVGSIPGDGINTPTLDGTAEADCSVQIYDGNVFLGQAVPDIIGNWSFTVGGPGSDVSTLPPGLHRITVTVTDAADNVSAPSQPLALTIIAPVVTNVFPSFGAGHGGADHRHRPRLRRCGRFRRR